MAGFVLHRLARMAHIGDRVTVGEHVLEVADVDGHRITRIRVSALPPGEDTSAQD